MKTEYAADKAFNRTHIAVTTTNGVVTLSGTVPSEELHRRALEMVGSTGGVTGTKDKLQVAHTRARRRVRDGRR